MAEVTPPIQQWWQPTEIHRFIKNFDTGTEAVLVQTDAGNGYLKAMGNAGGEHCLACEWVATHLARWFKLSTFDFALLKVTALDEIPLYRGGRARPGPAFITRAESGEPWSGKGTQLDRLINPQDISRLVVFDTWILNCDRHTPNDRRKPNYNNVFLSEEAPDGSLTLKAMDHTHAFTCGRDLTHRIADLDRIQDPDIYGDFPEFRPKWNPVAFHQALGDLALLTRTFVRDIVQSIPREWDVNENARKALIELIVQRAAFLPHQLAAIMEPRQDQENLGLPDDREDEP